MISIQLECARPLPCKLEAIGSIAFNGQGYALLTPRCKGVILLNTQLCPLSAVDTCTKYTSLCYDRKEHCYWAAANKNPSVLYQLNSSFQEIRCLKPDQLCEENLCDMSCGFHRNQCGLWLVFPHSVVFVNTKTGECLPIFCHGPNRINTAIVDLGCGQILSYIEEKHHYIEIICADRNEYIGVLLPNECALKAMVLIDVHYSETKKTDIYKVRLLLENCKLRINMIMDIHVFFSECQRDCHESCPCYACPCSDCPHDCCEPPCCRDACAKWEIMHSIAMEEAGLAHILNAEGEKLQKAVAISRNIEELLCINDSVKRTITQITQLEGHLYAKLEALTSCSTGECDNIYSEQENCFCSND